MLPVGAHGGDLLSRWARGQHAEVIAIVDEIAKFYSFIRTWSFLNGSYWAGRTFTLTEDVLRSFLDMLAARGVKVLLSQGDLFQSGVSSGTQACVQEIILSVLRTHRACFVGLDGCNEPCNNSDASPAELAEWVRPFVRAYPDLPVSLGSIVEGPNGQAHQQRRRDYCIPPATVFDHHISAPNHMESLLIGRHWAEGYESPLWLHVASEPRGPGARVTPPVVEDVDLLCAMAIASVMSGGIYVGFSGPGVISDEGERIEDMAGFAEVPQAVALLPKDVHRWHRFHGGSGNRGKRVYAVPSDDSARAEHALCDDGRFVALLHPNNGGCWAERPHRIEKQVDFGGAARLVIGTV